MYKSIHSQQYATLQTLLRQARSAAGLTQAAFCVRFCIPKRTLENWEGGQSKCPDYLRLLLAQAVGAYLRP